MPKDSIRGSAVNIAARMEQTAPAGALAHQPRHLPPCARRVRRRAAAAAGRSRAWTSPSSPTWCSAPSRARFGWPRAASKASRRAWSGATPSWNNCRTRSSGCTADGKLAAVTVVAEAGIGKSRLLYEFDNWAETRPERFIIFQGRAHPQTQSQPYGLLRDILAWRLQIADSDSMDAAKAEARDGHRAAVRRR